MVTIAVRYMLRGDPEAVERLRHDAQQEGGEAAAFARLGDVDLDVLQRDALTLLARHCGEQAGGGAGGPVQFRWRDGGEYVDDWVRGNQIFVTGYMEGYLNRALDIVGRSLPITSIPVILSGNGGVLRRSNGRFTAVVRHGETKEPYTARDVTAVGAISDAALFLSIEGAA
ncbi:MAG: hypothetical protein ACYDCQ_00010 [Dehalococcoidia bacterium]